jgi:protoporphyrinogen oxidase
MHHVEHLVVGAGVSGLAYANAVRGEAARRGKAADVLVLEKDRAPGGYCKTIEREGFVWDYSGHFFHFRHPEIEAWLRARMPADGVKTVVKRSRVRPVPDDPAREVDFPFQTHTHQLPRDELVRCIADLTAASRAPALAAPASFKEMLAQRYGRAICELFLVPYNEKLYATDLDRLDRDAMGRFFPQASLEDALAAMRRCPGGPGSDGSYNATFTYPRGGAIEYIRALLRDLPTSTLALEEALVAVDVDRKRATTTRRQIGFEHLVTSAPLPATLRACGVAFDEGAFTSNQVLVFNLGFDRKGRRDVHWIYFADPALAFYRVGFYDNIFDTERMSLYVEVGMPAGAAVDVEAMRGRVLADLSRAHIVTDHELVAWHHVVMDPAYAHITRRSLAEVERARLGLADLGVHPIGRYGGWTYCSIEDNIVEARALAATLMDRA